MHVRCHSDAYVESRKATSGGRSFYVSVAYVCTYILRFKGQSLAERDVWRRLGVLVVHSVPVETGEVACLAMSGNRRGIGSSARQTTSVMW